MISVPDAASIAAMREECTPGSVVTLRCDLQERYASTCYDHGWLAEQGIDLAPYTATPEASTTRARGVDQIPGGFDR